MVSIAIMGHGVVGSGVAEVLLKNTDSIAKKAGKQIEVKRILDLREFPDSPLADRFTKDFNEIVGDREISIGVETMGGLHPSYEFVKACLESGKSVVTSNKELVAAKGDELLKIAKANNLNFLFEASVGGGIPILRPLDQCLAANEVSEIAGILNGTTNFMLTKMIEDDMSFDDALALAQQLGYAEREPSADVDGHDAARKICILASLAFGRHVFPDQVHTEGIRGVSLEDVKCAASIGGVIKLIGRAKKQGDNISCIVAPMVLPSD
ncbi:MAG: homoserine dehydrogenase, partial [Clostridia bacterium]|nr:homoserine dehydrogenase [Clostridia bacterium]